MKRMIGLVFVTSLSVLIGCQEQPSEKVLHYQANNEIIGIEKEEIIGDISDTIYDSIDRSNLEAKEVFIHPIEGKGEDIVLPEGRYVIGIGEVLDGLPQSGRILVYDDEGQLLLNELVDSAYGVNSVTLDLNGVHKVHIDGLDQALIVPASTQISNELTAGIWEVGKDIEAGKYSVIAASEFAFGDLQVFEEGESPKLYEILNSSTDSKIEIELKKGQKLKISGLSYLKFEPEAS
ncbi:hypothetical protein [Ornithinibacillus xuwenensis]|uniref:DUF4382 domain-containing protein n=1 Tax=Ornithinibacillus xuwenensis TaxID=3144668 RepID=A0ABU9XKI9_9BACI